MMSQQPQEIMSDNSIEDYISQENLVPDDSFELAMSQEEDINENTLLQHVFKGGRFDNCNFVVNFSSKK